MAVQAQCLSNVLHENRSMREVKSAMGYDYSVQPQPFGSGRFLDQSHILFNNVEGGNSSNPRKRGREGSDVNQLMPMSTHPSHQLIDLAQLYSNSQPPPPSNVVSTGLQLAFSDQKQPSFQPQNLLAHQISLSTQSSVSLSFLSEDLSTQIKQQGDEIERFLQAQGEELRRTLAEKRQRHYRLLLGAAGEAAARRLRDKEVEAEVAARRNAELEARAAQVSAEAQLWQARARAQEATAATLQAQLQQAILSGGCAARRERAEGVISCAAGESGQEGGCAADAESAFVDPERVVVSTGPGCKECGKRVASVVLLPCRHLCVCLKCDGVVRACPLCLAPRSSSIEVSLC